jgi:hypothetical protein
MAGVLTNYGDGFTATGFPGSNTIGPVSLLGGAYALSLVDTGTPDATFQMLAPDGSTYISVHAVYTTNVYTTFYLAPGRYRITTGTGTSLSARLVRIPVRDE